jgi:DNA-binding NarL/FixJ family response regulator
MRILCADNSPITCMGIAKVLTPTGFSIGRAVSRYKELAEELRTNSYEMLISELRFRDADLLDMSCDLRASHPHLTILVYTFYDNPTYVARAAAYHFYDFVLKSGQAERLVCSVLRASTGVAPQESILTQAVRFLTKLPASDNPATQTLTKREFQILTHLSMGLSNREIGSLLGISVETVKEHVQNVLRKLKFEDRTEAAVWALRNGVPTFEIPVAN